MLGHGARGRLLRRARRPRAQRLAVQHLGQLQVSWKRVNEGSRVSRRRRTPRPLLLYVNYGDTHFPYDHRELDDLLGVPRLARAAHQPETREGVSRTYANAAANVDRAIEQLVARCARSSAPAARGDRHLGPRRGAVRGRRARPRARARRDADAGAAGGVGARRRVAGANRHVGPARARIQRSLAPTPDPDAPARALRAVPGRRILQYMAYIERPRLLWLRGVDSPLRFDTAVGTPRATRTSTR